MSYGELADAVVRAAEKAQLQPQDGAALALALKIATGIDESYGEPGVLSDLAPKLLAVLVELGLTPKSRGAQPRVVDGESGPGGALARLQAQYGPGSRRTAPLHAAPAGPQPA